MLTSNCILSRTILRNLLRIVHAGIIDRNERVFLELVNECDAFVAIFLVFESRPDLILEFLERGGTGGPAVFDPEHMKAVRTLEHAADLADGQSNECVVDRVDGIAAGSGFHQPALLARASRTVAFGSGKLLEVCPPAEFLEELVSLLARFLAVF